MLWFPLTCAFGSMDVWAGLVAQQEPAVIRAGIYAAYWRTTLAVTSAVRERKGALEGTGHRLRVFPEHRVQQSVACYHTAEGRQHLFAMTVR